MDRPWSLSSCLCSSGVVRDQAVPADLVAVSPQARGLTECFPAAVLDLDASRGVLAWHEADLDIGGVLGLSPEVPAVPEHRRRFPHRDAAPVVLRAVRAALEDASARARFEDDLTAADRVIARPPAPDTRRPGREGVLDRAGHVERHRQRLSHGYSPRSV